MGNFTLVYIGQVAYFFTLCSYAFRNISYLRISAIVASAAAIYYGFKISSEPLWIPILWNSFFIAVNAFQLTLAQWRKRNVALDPLENFLSKTILASFPSAEVKSFAALAEPGSLGAGESLIQMNTTIGHLYCILLGTANISIAGEKIAELGAGRFVGEMSLLTNSPTRSDVVAATDLKLLVWSHAAIDEWVDSDATRLSILQSALGTQIVEELLRQRYPKEQPAAESETAA